MPLRALFEKLSRRVVLKRRLPARCGGGVVFVSPDAALRFWKRDLEAVDKGLFDWAERFVSEGDVVWDVGANLGLFSFAAAFHAGSSGLVVAVEPDIFLADLLSRSAGQRKGIGAEMVILPVAAADSCEVRTLCIAGRGRASNYLEATGGRTQAGPVRETVPVISITLDWLAGHFRPPDVLKIDVEGAEYQVLRGGQRLLRRARPIILCEVGGPRRAATSDLLRSAGYQLLDLEDPSGGAVALAAHNTLAVPA